MWDSGMRNGNHDEDVEDEEQSFRILKAMGKDLDNIITKDIKPYMTLVERVHCQT